MATWIDFILNLAALLTWLSWRSLRFDPLARRKPATLIGTLRPAEPKSHRGWELLAALAGVIVLRAALYWLVGAPADWIPKMNLGVVVLAFRIDQFKLALLFSFLSFGRVLVIAYVWLLALVVINRSATQPDPFLRLVRLHLGGVSRWPRWAQVLGGVAAIVLIWLAVQPLLAQAGVLARGHWPAHAIRQALLIAAAASLTIKYLLAPLLLIHLLATYVYLGANPLWDFVSTTSQNALAPLRRLPLKSARLDFTPVIGIVALFLLFHTLPNALLRVAEDQDLALWPH